MRYFEKSVWGISLALLLLGLLFMPGCACFFAAPDCQGGHYVQVVDQDGMVVSDFTARLDALDGTVMEWSCPDDHGCSDEFGRLFAPSGRLSILTDDGRTAEIDLVTGEPEGCECGSIFNGSVVVE